MTIQQLKDKIKSLEKELNKFHDDIDGMSDTPVDEPKRWMAENGGGYCYVTAYGDISSTGDNKQGVDQKMHAIGNYFRTSKDAQRSTLCFIMHSEYEYWIPGSDMKKPETMPEGLQHYSQDSKMWLDISSRPAIWSLYTYRWPKSSYTGE
jgi:hypothetical protein